MNQPHILWTTKQWETAKDEEIICALFNPPQHIDPRDFGYIKHRRTEALITYLNILYCGVIPANVKKMLNLEGLTK